MKIYIHQTSCISPQATFGETDLETVRPSENNRLTVSEPKYEGIPKSILRRMGKAVRIGAGAASPLINAANDLAGIIIGTANGGMEDCVRFFNQIIEFDEGNLTPTNFVQSTTNAVASQIGLMAGNKRYNSTHVHFGQAFENALYDVFMQIQKSPGSTYLAGGMEEISDYNYNIDYLGGWNKKEIVSNIRLFESTTHGSIAGEGAAMFLMSGEAQGARSCLSALHTFTTTDRAEAREQFEFFIHQHFTEGDTPDVILTGESGDSRELPFYLDMEDNFPGVQVARYKHLTGEYPTVHAVVLWMADHILQSQQVPSTMVKSGTSGAIKKVLLYNCYHMAQHSLMLLTQV